MPELLRHNEHPLNQRAKALLNQVQGQDPDPGQLYLLLLVDYGIAHPDILLRPEQRQALQHLLDELHRKPDVAMQALLTTEAGDEVNLDPTDLDSPLQSATLLINHLGSHLAAFGPASG